MCSRVTVSHVSTLYILATKTLLLIMTVATARIDEFQLENESIEAYLELVEINFDVSSVDDDKKVAVSLNKLGEKTYILY